jgi:hypothetical protein
MLDALRTASVLGPHSGRNVFGCNVFGHHVLDMTPRPHALLCACPLQVLHCSGGDAHRPASIEGKSRMALRSKTMTKGPDLEEPAQEMFSQRRRPETGQFLLQVDRQTKASFTTFEAAEAAGRVIKKNFPVVRVAIYDSVTCVNKIIELEKA